MPPAPTVRQDLEAPPEDAPRPQVPLRPTTNPLEEVWGIFRRMLHAIVLLGMFLLLLVFLLETVLLVWSWWPVSEAALRFDSASAIFIIFPLPVGETSLSGAQALAAGVVLVLCGLGLLGAVRSRRYPGLGGAGTTFMAVLTMLTGAALASLGGYLAATGNLTDPTTVTSILPSPLALMVVRFSLLAQWHSLMMGSILMSIIVLFALEGPSLKRGLMESIRKATLPPIRTDNGIVTVFRVFLGIITFTIVYYALLDLVTVQPDVPDFSSFPIWDQLHSFTVASVWEEVLSRILMLGLPLFLYHAWTGRRERSGWRYVVGGGFTIDTAAFTLVSIQAIVFALAHVAGWDFWKVMPTVVSGIAFGYLFLRVGLWASIVLHFIIDYINVTATILGEWAPGAETAYYLVFFFLVMVGFVVMVHYAVIMLSEGREVVRRALAEDGPPAPTTRDGNP
jgi:hypothetical protein